MGYNLDIATSGDAVEVKPNFSPDHHTITQDTELAPLTGMLGLATVTSGERTQIESIWNFLSEKSNGVGDALYQFREIERKLSPPKLGQTRLGKVYDYVKLQRQSQDITKQLEAL